MAGKASVELCTEAESSGSVVQSMKLLFLMTEKESHKKKKKKFPHLALFLSCCEVL